MNNPIRYALWAAVSSERQAAADKISLELQEATARQRAVMKGWRETAGPYIVPGESRTRWVNLRDAEDVIPQLKRMLDAAQRGEFDVLVIYDYSRLRELIDPVSRVLAAYGVQVYSCIQSVDPVPPDRFDGKITPTAYIVQSVSMLTSHTEIDTMTRRLRSGVEGRIARGLHPSGKPPYGYKYGPYYENRSAAPLVIDPARAAICVKIKDLFLAGQTVRQIRDYLRSNGIPTPSGKAEWLDCAVLYTLKNPFYAGEVGLGYHRRVRDPRTGTIKEKLGQPEKVSRGEGKHEVLWDMTTHRAILAELESRGKKYKGAVTYRLSLLMACSEHNRTLCVVYSHAIRDDTHRIWYCPAGEKGHWHLFIRDSSALSNLTDKLTHDLQEIDVHLDTLQTPDKTALLQTALTDLLARRERLTDALETGNLAVDIYAERVRSLDLRLRDVRSQLDEAEAALLNREQRRGTLTALTRTLAAAPRFLAEADAQLVNTQLRGVIQRILVLPDGELKIIYK